MSELGALECAVCESSDAEQHSAASASDFLAAGCGDDLSSTGTSETGDTQTDTSGDGDGDPSTGDGDGDPSTGDGDGDPITDDTVYELQDGTIPTDSAVDVDGIWVTAVDETGFFAQEEAGGEHSGIYVHVGAMGPDISMLEIGDLIDVEGMVIESAGQTQIDATGGSVDEVGALMAIPAADLVTTAALAADVGEPWESVFVRIEGAPLEVTELPGGDEFVVSDGNPAVVDELLYNVIVDGAVDFPDFAVGASFTAVQGPLNFSVDAFKIAPRFAADLEGYVVPACGGTQEFQYTGEIVEFMVPDCATMLTIEAWGAQGGDGLDGMGVGGLGARMRGDFAVDGDETLSILVGGQGQDGTNTSDQAGAGGGGGSFVALAGEPRLVAGGGGGAMRREGGASCTPCIVPGGPGQVGTVGQAGQTNGGAGGTDGDGGTTWPWTGWHSGTGGGGFFTDGSAASNGSGIYGTPNGPGIAFVNGGAGGAAGSEGKAGGFGGGGAAGFTGGGGGGYSGGGSGSHDDPAPSHSGGGGGSFNAGSNQDNEAGVREGNGLVVITWE